MYIHTGMVEGVVALGCGIVGWKQPTDTGGEITRYIVRFYNTNQANKYTNVQRRIDPGQTWAIAQNLPSTGTVYAKVCIG